jgi:hypothetical protein
MDNKFFNMLIFLFIIQNFNVPKNTKKRLINSLIINLNGLGISYKYEEMYREFLRSSTILNNNVSDENN